MNRGQTQLLLAGQSDLHDVIPVPSSPVLPAVRPKDVYDSPDATFDRGWDRASLAKDNTAPANRNAANRPHDVFILSSTPDTAVRTVPRELSPDSGHKKNETTSRFFAESASSQEKQGAVDIRDPRTHLEETAALGSRKEAQPDLLPALRRRRDWTPPPNDTLTAQGSDPASAALEAWSSSPSGLAKRTKDVFNSLHASFGCQADTARPSNFALASPTKGDHFTKRKAIEAVTIGEAGQADPPAPLAKPKAAKKRTRTITELAVAAYANSSSGSGVTDAAAPFTKRQDESTLSPAYDENAECRPGHPTSKPRKLKTARQLATTKKERKKKAVARPCPPVLLSPRSAMKESMGQDFLYGTSSQLAREESPTFLRDLQAAMQSSNEDERLSDTFRGATAVDLSSHVTPNVTLWSVAARNADGTLTSNGVVDLEDDIEFPEDPHQVILMAQEAAKENYSKSTTSLTTAVVDDEPLTIGSGRTSGSGGTTTQTVSSGQPPSQMVNDPQTVVEKAPPRPNFQLLDTAQLAKKVSSYGYKSIRGRKAMIALLDQCWEAKNQPLAGNFSQQSSMSTKANASESAKDRKSTANKDDEQPKKRRPAKVRPAVSTSSGTVSSALIDSCRAATNTSTSGLGATLLTPSYTQTQFSTATGREPAMQEPDGQILFEIRDSESEGGLSSPEVPCSLASEDLSVMEKEQTQQTDETEETDDTDETDLSLALALTGQEADLFRYITKAVVTAPRAKDTANPSWHEKILMYDTIILETFTAWLNDGPLLAAGYDGPVTAIEVKKCSAMGDAKGPRGASKPPSVPAASASVVIISPQNGILLLHRVQNGTFSSAHVFPGGNLSKFHEGALVPSPESAERHVDGPAYRLAAIRETFEESGVLLARPVGQNAASVEENGLLYISDEARRSGRLRVANGEKRFTDWLASVGGEPDSENLVPFTRWITPPNLPRRFTTQMYLYLMPLDKRAPGPIASQSQTRDSSSTIVQATADLTEVMAAEFATASTWVQRAQRNEIIMFPPQMYILSLLAPLLRGGGTSPAHFAAERQQLAVLLHGSGLADGENKATWVPWADRVISPRVLGRLPDGRSIMGLDRPGPELRNSGRSGDLHRVVLVGNLSPGPPRNVELRLRADVASAIRVPTAKPKAIGDGEAKL
ncbi:nudix domain containing protein [Niveomyces insectorum RCEF 264]|uniref:Structure-specific endonuclease subunit SLX4 n=1 Tax=Niveomyces insectorum RCEF 264 TaxID=1081102 RepID=A0A167N8S3_9HYPO|nr:nudix domain containing protein [Niveomyces insectorum RCEF 264]